MGHKINLRIGRFEGKIRPIKDVRVNPPPKIDAPPTLQASSYSYRYGRSGYPQKFKSHVFSPPPVGGPMMVAITFMPLINLLRRKKSKEAPSQALQKRTPPAKTMIREPRSRRWLMRWGLRTVSGFQTIIRWFYTGSTKKGGREKLQLLPNNLKWKKINDRIEKIRLQEGGHNIPEVDPQISKEVRALAQEKGYALELVVGRYLQEAKPQTVEAWLQELFGNDLRQKLSFIRRAQLKGGAQLLVDLLKVKGLDSEIELFAIETLGDLGSRKALLELDGIVGRYLNSEVWPGFFKNPEKAFAAAAAISRIEPTQKSLTLLETILKYIKENYVGGTVFESGVTAHFDAQLALVELKKKLNKPNEEKILSHLKPLAKYKVPTHRLTPFLKTYYQELTRIMATELLKESFAHFPKNILSYQAQIERGSYQSHPEQYEYVQALIKSGEAANLEYFLILYNENIDMFFLNNRLPNPSNYGDGPLLDRINEAKIMVLSKHEGFPVLGARYLERMGGLPKLSNQAKLALARAWHEINRTDEALEIIEDLLSRPGVALEAGLLLDEILLGWDDSLPKIHPKRLGPFR